MNVHVQNRHTRSESRDLMSHGDCTPNEQVPSNGCWRLNLYDVGLKVANHQEPRLQLLNTFFLTHSLMWSTSHYLAFSPNGEMGGEWRFLVLCRVFTPDIDPVHPCESCRSNHELWRNETLRTYLRFLFTLWDVGADEESPIMAVGLRCVNAHRKWNKKMKINRNGGWGNRQV